MDKRLDSMPGVTVFGTLALGVGVLVTLGALSMGTSSSGKTLTLGGLLVIGGLLLRIEGAIKDASHRRSSDGQ